ncbi:hypothetical protein [Glutamicibacter sp. BW77]|uniref:hypothetical protein n=1 Tax=Glutamicibacter sp. BW77 TaxID=2024402 RepID=UPI000BB691BB|nr:hypothetical protein [Glutamicibacter sp. BW77]PCC37271.1 hypothetical protein CIK74_01440 [Glutamicibacter sp. BW77]
MSIVAPPRAQSSTSTPETPQNTAIHTTKPRWCTRPTDGRIAAILAHTAKGHRPFTKAETPEGFTAKGKSQFNAAKEAMATKHAHTPAPLHIKRVSRAQETSDRAIAWAIPHGSKKIDHTAQAWRAARSLDELLCRRKDCQRNILAVLWVLLRYTDHDSMTARITWDTVATKARVSRATVGNALRFLRTHGILGIVASGRSAEYAAKAGQQAQNEAPVYVICRPIGLGLRPQDAQDTTATRLTHHTPNRTACGNNLEPLPVGGLTTYEVSSYTRTREENTQNEPLRGTENLFGHGSAVRTHQAGHRPVELWPAHRTISSRGQGLSASAEILRLIPGFRPFSKKNILSIMKPFFQTGWTISDIQHALNWRTTPGLHGRESWGPLPQHDRETQSYIDYCRILRAAILHRMNQWRTGAGEIMASRSQRAAAASNQARAATRAANERRARLAAQRPAHQSAAATGAASVRAAIAAARRIIEA